MLRRWAATLLAAVALLQPLLAFRMNSQVGMLSPSQIAEPLTPSMLVQLESENAFIDFSLKDLGNILKDQAKSIGNNIKEAAMDTWDNLKPIITDKLKDFKKTLLEAKDKALAAVKKFKDQLVQGLGHLKNVAVGELKKYWKHFDGVRQRLAEARDAVVQQLMTGSLTGAADVLKKHLDLVMQEAKTATGNVKDQLLKSAELLKSEAANILQNTMDGTKNDLKGIFTDTMKSSTVLVNQLLGEVKAQIQEGANKGVDILKNGANEMAGTVKEAGEGVVANVTDKVKEVQGQLTDKVKNLGQDVAGQLTDKLKDLGKDAMDKVGQVGDSLQAPAPGSLLAFGLVEVPEQDLQDQLRELEEARDEIHEATLQATTALVERATNVARTLGERAGERAEASEAGDAGSAFEAKLAALLEAAEAASLATAGTLDKVREAAVSENHDMPADLLAILADEGQHLQGAKAKVLAAWTALSKALEPSTLKSMGLLKAQIFKLRGEEQQAAKAKIIEAGEAWELLQKDAVVAAEAAAEALQGCGAVVSENRGALKEHLKKTLAKAQGQHTSAEGFILDELERLKHQVEAVSGVAVNYGSQLRTALSAAEKDLEIAGGHGSGGKTPVKLTVSDIGGPLAKIVVTSKTMALEEANRALQQDSIIAADVACDVCEGHLVDVCCFDWLSGDAEIAPDALAELDLSKLELRLRLAWEKDLEPELVHYVCTLKGIEADGRAKFAQALREKGVSKLEDAKEMDAGRLLPEGSSKVVKGQLHADREAKNAQAAQAAASKTGKHLMNQLADSLKMGMLPNGSSIDSLHLSSIDKALMYEKLQQENGILEGEELTERQLIDRHGLLRGLLISSNFNGDSLDIAVDFDRFYSDDVLNSKVVLQPPDSTTDFIQEATTKEDAASQERTIKNFGFSTAEANSQSSEVSAGVSASGWGVSASLSTAIGKSSKNTKAKDTQKKNSTEKSSSTSSAYFCKSRYILEPRQLLSLPTGMLVPTTDLLDAFNALMPVKEEEDPADTEKPVEGIKEKPKGPAGGKDDDDDADDKTPALLQTRDDKRQSENWEWKGFKAFFGSKDSRPKDLKDNKGSKGGTSGGLAAAGTTEVKEAAKPTSSSTKWYDPRSWFTEGSNGGVKTEMPPEVSPGYEYMVVAGPNVVLSTNDLTRAKAKLKEWPEGAEQPSRMVCAFKDGVLDEDPSAIGPKNYRQAGGVAFGFNSYWADTEDMKRMNNVCRAFMVVSQSINPQAASDFLYRFGSHICPRVMLGGWWRITSSVTSQSEVSTLTTNQLATEAISETMEKERSLEVKASASGSFFGASVSASAGYGTKNSESNSKGSTKEEGRSAAQKTAMESSVIEVQQEWKGGNSGMGPERWRESLKFERNSNWKLIDRYLDHCVGLWHFAPPGMDNVAKGLCLEWATKIMGAELHLADQLCEYRALGLVTQKMAAEASVIVPVDIQLGPSNSNEKCVAVKSVVDVHCDEDAGNLEKRAKGCNHCSAKDTFKVVVKNRNTVCAKRTDAAGGWGMDLSIQCEGKQAEIGYWVVRHLTKPAKSGANKSVKLAGEVFVDRKAAETKFQQLATRGSSFNAEAIMLAKFTRSTNDLRELEMRGSPNTKGEMEAWIRKEVRR